MKILETKWCVNCGKPSIRCQCKKPVINSETSEVGREKDRMHHQVPIEDRTNLGRFRYGRGSR